MRGTSLQFCLVAQTIEIDFDRPIAVFALPHVVLLPHVAEWLMMFEPRYQQMVETCVEEGGGVLQSASPIALASYAPAHWMGERIALGGQSAPQEPALRRIVCVCKIFEHRPLDDGRHQVLLHGICRARIEAIDEANDERLYPRALLRPTESLHRSFGTIRTLRSALLKNLEGGELARSQALRPIRRWLTQEQIPTEMLLEQIGLLLAKCDAERYRLLAEPSLRERARLILTELATLDSTTRKAAARTPPATDRGISLN
ncbi:MAG: hypothetical protein EXS10_08940 [Phycisphaerales bacterium]|nr:hypothetical protein [Phycisphaerales bacterium]